MKGHSAWCGPIALLLLMGGCGDDGHHPDGGPDGGVDAAADASADGGSDAGPVIPPFPGLTDDVEVLVDDMGFPHMYGSTDADVFYAGGYMMARDRLFQMDLLRRRALGRWSEVLGARHREDDQISRLFNFRHLGELDAQVLEEEGGEAWDLVVAWIHGINRFIEEVLDGEQPLPYGFGRDELDYLPELWTPADLIAVSRIAFFSTSNTLEGELLTTVLRDFFPEAFNAVQFVKPFYPVYAVPPEDRPATTSAPATPPAPPAARPPPADLGESLAHLRRLLAPYRLVGSNNFAVDGRFTDNGRPVIANDPHLMLEVPNVFYGLHLNSKDGGGTMNVAGFTLAGSLGVSAGRNDRVAWTVTTAFGDVMDVWEVQLVEGGVKVGDEVLPVVRREEPIAVRGEGMPVGVGTVDRFVAEDVPGRGVLLPRNLAGLPIESPGHRLLMGYTGFESFHGSASLLALQRAASIDDFERAVDGLTGLGFNFVGADATGISYRVGLGVPNRGDPATIQAPYMVMDGDDATSLWTGELLPASMLPHSRATERGFLVTANNDPFGFTDDGSILDDPWYYGGLFAPGFRAKRLEDELTRLTARGGVTVDDLRTLQLDVHSTLADALVPALVDALGRVDTEPALAEFRGDADLQMLGDVLDAWDRRMTRDSPEALVFRAFAFNLSSAVLSDDVGALYNQAIDIPVGIVIVLKITGLAVTGAYPDGDGIVQDGVDATLLTALADTKTWLVERFGSADPSGYRYSDVFGVRLTHDIGGELDEGFIPVDGADDTVANFAGSFRDDAGEIAERWESRNGPVMRIVSSFADDGTPESVVSFPMGQSGEPDSPHFDDGLTGWVEGMHRPLPFRRAEVEAAMEERIVIEAAGTARP